MSTVIMPGDLCRITVVTPTGRADLVLPAAVPLAELMPTLVRHASTEPPTEQARQWVLQRLGEDPLDEDAALGTLAVRDGEVLHLRPRATAIPPIGFDDIVQGVGTAIAERPDRWRASLTRWLFLAAAASVLLTALGGLLLPGSAAVRAAIAGSIALLLVGAGVVWSRAFGDALVAALLGAAAMPFAGLCGLLVPVATSGDALFTGPGLLSAGAIGCVTAGLGLTLVSVAAPLFIGALTASAGVLAAGLLVVLGLRPDQSAAVVASLAFVFTVLAPVNAARLVGLRVPQLPSGAEELRTEVATQPQDEVLSRAARADRLTSALFAASGLLTIGCAVVLSVAGGRGPWTLLGVLSVALLIRARIPVSAVQRFSVAFAGIIGAALLWFAFIVETTGVRHTVAIFALVVVAGLMVAGARKLPDHQLLPYWGRAADLSDTLLAIAIVPLMLWVIGAFSFARTLLT